MADLDSFINEIDDLRRQLVAVRKHIDGMHRQVIQLLKRVRSTRGAPSKSKRSRKLFKETTVLSRNLNALRLECGWSYEDLEHWANISRSRIADHINYGRAAYPRTLKKYADAFSKKLGRPITASDLLK